MHSLGPTSFGWSQTKAMSKLNTFWPVVCIFWMGHGCMCCRNLFLNAARSALHLVENCAGLPGRTVTFWKRSPALPRDWSDSLFRFSGRCARPPKWGLGHFSEIYGHRLPAVRMGLWAPRAPRAGKHFCTKVRGVGLRLVWVSGCPCNRWRAASPQPFENVSLAPGRPRGRWGPRVPRRKLSLGRPRGLHVSKGFWPILVASRWGALGAKPASSPGPSEEALISDSWYSMRRGLMLEFGGFHIRKSKAPLYSNMNGAVPRTKIGGFLGPEAAQTPNMYDLGDSRVRPDTRDMLLRRHKHPDSSKLPKSMISEALGAVQRPTGATWGVHIVHILDFRGEGRPTSQDTPRTFARIDFYV